MLLWMDVRFFWYFFFFIHSSILDATIVIILFSFTSFISKLLRDFLFSLTLEYKKPVPFANCMLFLLGSLSGRETIKIKYIFFSKKKLSSFFFLSKDSPKEPKVFREFLCWNSLNSHIALEKTRPSRPIRCDVWIVERMRDRPTDRLTNLPTDQRTELVLEALCRA